MKSLRNATTLATLLASSHAFVFCQQQPRPDRVILAVRASDPIHIDGRLTEAVWKRPGETGFVQREPQEGAPASQRTEAWIAYDDDALYVAVHLYDTHPDSIVGRIARRDQDSESDEVAVGVDAARDKRTAHYFVVNPAGAITDGTFSNDTHTDSDWDGVWDVGTDIDENGWSAEFRIPYSQLRFPKRDRYAWGVEIYRRIKRRNEDSYLVLHPRTDQVRVSRWIEIRGIEGIEPPARVELLPYFTATGKFLEPPAVHSFNEGRDDPFSVGRKYPVNIGADLKIGLAGDVTLDASLNPDFAQVEVDPTVVNLTAYQWYYQEKRPFFIEGSNILRFGRGGATYLNDFYWTDPKFFYSRRIGRAPQASVTHPGFKDIPDRTTILGAAKVSGKISDSWSFAALSAVTDREYGRVDSAGVRFKEEIEPLTFYGIARTLKEFNEARQAIGVIGTVVERNLRDSRLKGILNSRAASLGIDGWVFLDESKVWVLTGWAGASIVTGSTDRMIALQRSPEHYFQRPDAGHLEVDSSATSMVGWSSRVWLDKVVGNWVFNAAIGAIHPKFETNDAGFMTNADYINAHIFGGYEWYKPEGIFRTKGVTGAVVREYDFGGYSIGESYQLRLFGQLMNYWSAYLNINHNAETYTLPERTRGGPRMRALESQSSYLSVSSDSRESLYGSLSTAVAKGRSGVWYLQTGLNLSWKVSKTLSISGGPDFYRRHDPAWYVWTQPDQRAVETYRSRYIFGTLDLKQFSATIRVNWIFTPKLSFQLYVQPFLSTGAYSGIKELARPNTFSFNHYGEGPSTLTLANNVYTVDPDGAGPASSFSIWNPDFNYKSLRANAVFRWEYLPGSTIYFVWTNEKVDYETSGRFEFGRDMRTLLRDRPDNVFSIKLTYWFNP